MDRPAPGEYKPFFQKYVDLVPEGDILRILHQNHTEVIHFFNAIPVEKHDYNYADGKWTIKQVLLHMTDTERAMSYRAFTGIRGDKHSVLYVLDEDDYAANADVTGRSMADLLEEFSAVRTATEKLFVNIAPGQSVFPAQMEDGSKITARAVAYILVGHTIHHLQIIKERYL